MAGDDAKPSEYPFDDRGMQPKPRQREFVPRSWSIFKFGGVWAESALDLEKVRDKYRT